MARITTVKAARQRYATVPVIDPETGEQKVTPVMRRNGTQKTDKHGKPVVMRVTREDRSQPLPNLKCEACGKEITPGTGYKWIKPKSGPYGGRQRQRCLDCPTWHVWDYSYSLSARVAQISYDFSLAIAGVESVDDVQSALDDTASAVRELAEEKRESASNIEDGFGHATSTSDDLNEVADSLDGWADEIEQVDIPELPEAEAESCDECSGTGKVGDPQFFIINTDDGSLAVEDGFEDEDSAQTVLDELLKQPLNKIEDFEIEERDADEECSECGGTGEIEGDEPTEDQIGDWRSEVEDACSIVDECPV